METGQEDDKLPKASSTWRVEEEGANLEDLPELISKAAEPSQEVTDEEGLGHAAAPQDQQALGQDLRSRQLRNTTRHQTCGQQVTRTFTAATVSFERCGPTQDQRSENPWILSNLDVLMSLSALKLTNADPADLFKLLQETTEDN